MRAMLCPWTSSMRRQPRSQTFEAMVQQLMTLCQPLQRALDLTWQTLFEAAPESEACYVSSRAGAAF
jgi:hypothetical protein